MRAAVVASLCLLGARAGLTAIGGSCESDGQCASGACGGNSWKCMATASIAMGGTCFSNAACTSGMCSINKCIAAASVANGGSCAQSAACTSGACSATTCVAAASIGNGGACESNAACASGLCNHYSCVAPASLSLGSSCSASVQCESGQCTEKCVAPASLALGSPCTTSVQCKSENCDSATNLCGYPTTPSFGSSPVEICKVTSGNGWEGINGKWACTNGEANSAVFKSGCLWTNDELPSTKFSDTGFTTFPGTVLTHRIDAGKSNVNAYSTNPNDAHGLTNVVFANNCATDHPGYPTPMFKQGTDFYRLDTETQELLCDNESDNEEEMVYFACCDLTSKVCVDPTVVAGTDNSVNTASSASSSSPSSPSSSSTFAAAVAGSVGVAVGGAVVGVIAHRAFSNRAISSVSTQQEEQLEHVDMPQSL